MKAHSLKLIKRYHNISLGINISTIQYWFCIGNYMGYKLMWYYDPFSPKDCQHGIKLDFKAHFAQYTKLEDLQLLTVALGVQPKKETLLTTALWWQKSKTTLEFKTWFLVALKCFIGINNKKRKLRSNNGCCGARSVASVLCFVIVQLGEYVTRRTEESHCHHSQHKGGFLKQKHVLFW